MSQLAESGSQPRLGGEELNAFYVGLRPRGFRERLAGVE